MMDFPSIKELKQDLIDLITKAPLSKDDKTTLLKKAANIFDELLERTAPYDYGGETGYAGDFCIEPPYDNMSISEAEEVFCKKPNKDKYIEGSEINRDYPLTIKVSLVDLRKYTKILEEESAKTAIFIPKCNTEDAAVIAIKSSKDAARIRDRLFAIETSGMFWPEDASDEDYIMISEYGEFVEGKLPVGSRVRLTKNKKKELEKTGGIAAFPRDTGTVDTVREDGMYIVCFDNGPGFLMRNTDIELIP